MNKKVLLSLVLATGAWVSQGSAQDQAPTDPAAPLSEKQKALSAVDQAIADFDAKQKTLMVKIRAESDPAKQRQIFEEESILPDETVALILKTAEETPTAENLDKALAWSLSHVFRTEQFHTVSDHLLSHFKGSDSLRKLAKYSNYRPEGEALLRKIMEVTSNEKVRQTATYFLSLKLIDKEAGKAEGLEILKALIATEGLAESNPKLLSAAQSQLFSSENLSIGSSIPDIVGKDHEDKEFKLSDYKGKVVLLDFWGIW